MTDITRTDGPEVLFHHHELADRASGVVKLHPGFDSALAELRMVFGLPMIVNSCCRSEERNRQMGGHLKSLHIYDKPAHGAEGTLAIDIRRPDGQYARMLVVRALDLGWSVGVAVSFIHLDRRDLVGLPPALFGYGPR